MSTFKNKEVTYAGVTKIVKVGLCRLLQPINMEPSGLLTLNNEKKTTYRLATVEIINDKGDSTELIVQLFGKNIAKMEERGAKFEVGASYLTTLDRVPKRDDPTKFITLGNMSHLRNAVTDEAVIDDLWSDVFAITADVEAEEPAIAK